MQRLFGTDGIRGIANVDPMTADIAYKLGKISAIYFKNKKKGRIKFIIGKDTRISCDMLENALTAGLCTYGADVIKAGIIPTPGIAYLTKKHKADCGIMISASHNSFEDNGIKFFSSDGYKLSEKTEDELADLLIQDNFTQIKPTGMHIGRVIENEQACYDYLKYVKNTIPTNVDFSKLKAVIDCANGATSTIAPELFKELGIKIIVKHNNPNGININLNCGSLYPGSIKTLLKKEKANIGICFDGDGDRIILIDEKGNIVDGDFIMAICTKHLINKNKSMKKILISTVMSNLGLEKFAEEFDVEMIRTKVGDKYVLEEMIKKKAILGGEQSGHIIFKEHTTTGDGMITAMQILYIMVHENKKLSELAKIMKKYPQVLINVPVKNKKDFNSIAEIKKIKKEIEKQILNDGRLLLRYSGTEPIARIMIEGADEQMIKKMGNKLANAIRDALG